jgi:hypothetical protein
MRSFTLLLIVIVLVGIFVFITKKNKEHFYNEFTALNTLTGPQKSPEFTLAKNPEENSDGNPINSGRVINAYKLNNKTYGFKPLEVSKSYPETVKNGKVDNLQMVPILWQLTNNMYEKYSFQKNIVKEMEVSLNKSKTMLQKIQAKIK